MIKKENDKRKGKPYEPSNYSIFRGLLKDYEKDYITQENYDDFKEKYLYEINRLNMEKENINKSKINSYNTEWMKNFKKIDKLEKIDRNIVDNFIENISVGNNKDLNIVFKYRDEYKILLEYLKNQKNVI